MEASATGEKSPRELHYLVRSVTDALYVLNGKWKLPILISLSYNQKRFGELADDIPDITDRMLARELRELEVNLLVTRRPVGSNPTKMMYEITSHGKSLHTVILELSKWGVHHKKVISCN